MPERAEAHSPEAAEERLKAAEAELATTPADDPAKLKAVQARIKAAKNTIAMQDGALRDMPSALRGARVKKAIYERAYKVLSKKAVAAPAATPVAPGSAGPSYYEEDEYTKRHPWSSPAYH